MAHRYPRTDSGEIVHSLQFNHDQTVFSCAMEDGVRIYNVEPLVEHTRLRADKVGSIRACYLLNRTNLIALVGGGKRPKFAENSLLIFDDALKEFVLDFTFSSPVVNVKMELNRLVVVLEHQIHVFTFPREPKKILSLETRPNARGICAISPAPTASGSRILVFPCNKIGTVQAVDLSTAGAGITSSPTTVHAHQSEIACLALSADSTLLATASKKGTLIRVFDLVSKKKLVELRRGSDPALLYCINFSPDGDYLCCSADTGTVHIFALKKTSLNRRLAFSKMGLSLGNYAESQWALATFTVPPERACLCGFIDSSNVAAICKDGTYHKYTFNSEGNCTRVAYDVYFDLYDEDDF